MLQIFSRGDECSSSPFVNIHCSAQPIEPRGTDDQQVISHSVSRLPRLMHAAEHLDCLLQASVTACGEHSTHVGSITAWQRHNGRRHYNQEASESVPLAPASVLTSNVWQSATINHLCSYPSSSRRSKSAASSRLQPENCSLLCFCRLQKGLPQPPCSRLCADTTAWQVPKPSMKERTALLQAAARVPAGSPRRCPS